MTLERPILVFLLYCSQASFIQHIDARDDTTTPPEVHANRLNREEYDETTWSARNFRTFVKQRVSVAIHTAAASEVRDALGLAALDPRGPA